MTEMTVENQTSAVEYENVYQGKKWGLGKLLGIFAAICATMFVRDLGMAFVYGSIYDKVAEEGMDNGVTFMHYVFMVLLFAIPMIFPFVLRMTKGAYFDEPERSLIPSFGKVGTVIAYIVVGVVAIIPVALSLIGIFTPAYMFVAANMALVIVSGVVLFYYFGTYFMQRNKASIGKKYVFSTVVMIVATAVSSALAAVAAVVLNGVLGGEEGGVAIIGHVNAYTESLEPGKLLMPALIMVGMIALAAIGSGLLYHMTQNILFASVPTFVLAYSNVILIQRINEATSNIAKWNKNIEDYLKRPNVNTDKITELQEKIPLEETNITICYVLIGLMAVLLLAVCVRAIIGMIANKKEA